MGATNGAGIAYPSRISSFTSGFCGVGVVGSLVLMKCFVYHCMSSLRSVSFGHYIVCPLIYGSNYLFGIFILSTASVV
jgi:hypothetical protein